MRCDKTSIINGQILPESNGLNTSICYIKKNIAITEDKQGQFHNKNITFEIKDVCFISKNLSFQLPKRKKISIFGRVALALGLPLQKVDSSKKINIKTISIRKLLHILTMMVLKDMKIITNSYSLTKQKSYGEHVFEIYYKASCGSGRIQATQPSMRWLNEQDTEQLKSKLFSASSYQPGNHSMKYQPTEVAEKIIKKVFSFFSLLEFETDKIKHKNLDFTLTIDHLRQIRLRDIMILLSNCTAYNNGFVIRPLITDKQYSRVYSVFTNISHHTRQATGYINYDVGTALQTICLTLAKEPSRYPLHQKLVQNKNEFRSKIILETGKDKSWVKKELNKIINLDNMPKKYQGYPILKAYFHEAKRLKIEIISLAEPAILSRAKQFAKPKWEKVWNKDTKKYTHRLDGLKESSIFFFIWTQWERLIRQSMKNCFSDPSSCQEVHDAVYTKEWMDPKTIEQKVLNETGFVVKISAEKELK